MTVQTPRAILAASDLDGGSDAVVRSAALLAARSGAELHVLHSLDLPAVPSRDLARRTRFQGQVKAAEERLREQVARTMPAGVSPASQKVIVYVAHKAILDRAEEISADLIVVGRHRGGAAGAHFLGTTADRVVRAADVPCLVVLATLADLVRRIGVPTDCSDPAQGALETALTLGLQLGGHVEAGEPHHPEVRVMHVGWGLERDGNPDLEATVVRPNLERQVSRAVSCVPGAEALRVNIEVLWANDPVEASLAWAGRRELDLLVMGTHGRGAVTRALLGSMASAVARQAPCPVLLVPPSFWSGHAHAPRLERVLVATDFGEPALEAARWSTRDLAPGVEHVLVHVLELPARPALPTGRSGPHEELLRTARVGAQARLEELRSSLASEEASPAGVVRIEVREGQAAEQVVRLAAAQDADLILLAGCGLRDERHGAWKTPGATVERVVRSSATPVLVVREPRDGPPGHLLVAVDGSEPSRRALAWAEFLRRRFDASLSVLHVESPLPYAQNDVRAVESATESGPADASRASGLAWTDSANEERTRWLGEQLRRAGVALETATLQVRSGRPADEIAAEQARLGADLIVMGTHGRGVLGRILLGSVAHAVLRTARCPVLLVGEPGRTQEE